MVGLAEGVVVGNLYTDPKISGPCPFFSDGPVTGKFPDVSILYSKQQSINRVRYVTLYCKRDVCNHIESPK